MARRMGSATHPAHSRAPMGSNCPAEQELPAQDLQSQNALSSRVTLPEQCRLREGEISMVEGMVEGADRFNSSRS